MRPAEVGGILLRVLVAAVCILCAWQSIRFARIDRLANNGNLGDLQQAIRMDPENPSLVARAALLRSESGDDSPEVNTALRRALVMNPRNSQVLIALGLREEFRGDSGGAERDLMRAVSVDRQFTPAWSLASFYFRADQPAKFWPVVQGVLSLDPLVVDLRPLFDLCWRETDNPEKVLSIIPRRPSIIFPYLQFLIESQRVNAAVKLVPTALSVARPTVPADRDELLALVDLLLQQKRGPDAAQVWNQLIDRDLVQSGRIQPDKGMSLADPEFQYPGVTQGFAWRAESPPGTSARIDRYARFEFDGNQPERSRLLSTVAAVVPGRTYRMLWKIDSAASAWRTTPAWC